MYYDARKRALRNGMLYHLAAILWRNKSVIRISTNNRKTHPKFVRTYPDGSEAAHMHAEMDAIRFAQPGDRIEVMRWGKNGQQLRMAKPCNLCMKHLIDVGISEVRYTDANGNWQKMRL